MPDPRLPIPSAGPHPVADAMARRLTAMERHEPSIGDWRWHVGT